MRDRPGRGARQRQSPWGRGWRKRDKVWQGEVRQRNPECGQHKVELSMSSVRLLEKEGSADSPSLTLGAVCECVTHEGVCVSVCAWDRCERVEQCVRVRCVCSHVVGLSGPDGAVDRPGV